jgi:NADP-dependent 3-hydroxy acid dehydrogenase YdfG
MSNGIAGKTVVITGASSGLGEATARHLAAEGANVVLGARRVERIQSLAEELTGRGGKALAVATDVTDREQVKALVDAAVQAFGRIDVIINNAGLMPQAPLERLKVDEWDRMIDVNIKGVLYGIAAALPHMRRQKSGQIINVSSVAGHKVGPGFTVYAATKHAVRALSEGLRQEVKPYNIRTTVVSPGAVASELPNSVTEPDVAERIQKFYEELAIPAESFARVVAFAISQPEEVDGDVPFPPHLPDDRRRCARRSRYSPRPRRSTTNHNTGVQNGDHPNRVAAVEQGARRLVHRHGPHRPAVPASRPGASGRRQRHVRARSPNGVAHPSAGADSDHHGRLRLGPTRGGPGRGSPSQRRGLVPGGRAALARGDADDGHDSYRHSGTA